MRRKGAWKYRGRAAVVAFFLLAVAACAPSLKPPEPQHAPAMVRIKASQYPAFFDDMNFDGLAHGISMSLSYLNRVPKDRRFTFAEDRYSRDHMVRSLKRFQTFLKQQPSAEALSRFITDHYRVYRASGRSRDQRVLFTGYYEPLLRGSSRQTPVYRYPIYRRPKDLQIVDLSRFSSRFKGETIIGRVDSGRFVPYYDREAIDQQGVLKDKAPVLAWLDNPVDPFFLHIQGSGRIFLETGQVLNVHYHTTNGRPYRSIGKLLIDNGAIPRSKMSMQAIRDYLRSHPETVDVILNHNPSYIFFKPENEGPLGSLGVMLTPGRSIATDRRLFPPSALVYIETQKPLMEADGRITSWTELKRFALNQDTGGAIRGPGRADLFWGNGPYAETAAGHLQHPGAVFFMILSPQSR